MVELALVLYLLIGIMLAVGPLKDAKEQGAHITPIDYALEIVSWPVNVIGYLVFRYKIWRNK